MLIWMRKIHMQNAFRRTSQLSFVEFFVQIFSSKKPKDIYVCNKNAFFLESSNQFIGRETNLECFLAMYNTTFPVILIHIQSLLLRCHLANKILRKKNHSYHAQQFSKLKISNSNSTLQEIRMLRQSGPFLCPATNEKS